MNVQQLTGLIVEIIGVWLGFVGLLYLILGVKLGINGIKDMDSILSPSDDEKYILSWMGITSTLLTIGFFTIKGML